MALTAAQQAALTRMLSYYEGDNPYNAQTNPGGFRQGGQVVNFVPALKDVASAVQGAASLVGDALSIAPLGLDPTETDIVSAATTDIGSVATIMVRITGTTAITSFGTVPKRIRFVRFAGSPTLTHDATKLILPGAANIVTAAGDTCIATSDANGIWTVRNYQRADGSPISSLRAPASVSSSGSFTANDNGRLIRALGTITRTLPPASSLAPGWATQQIENTGTGIVTVAASGTDPLDGTAGGTLVLWPKQSAWFYLDTDGWHTVWMNRRALLVGRGYPTTTLTADFTIPVGFPKVKMEITGARVVTSGANLYALLSDDNGSTFKTGSADYHTAELTQFGGINSANPLGQANSQPNLLLAYSNDANFSIRGELILDPAGGGYNPNWKTDIASSWNGYSEQGRRLMEGACVAISSNRATTIRLTTTGGGFTATSIALYGEPA